MRDVLFAILLTWIVFLVSFLAKEGYSYMQNSKFLVERIIELETIIECQREQIEQQREVSEKMMEFLEQWEIKEKEVTGYAPLDPNAVEGMCFSGDPNITASGAQVVPGVTAAGTLPFGTEVFVPGYGVYEIQDRGGMVGDGQLDITFETQRDALKFGRQTMQVAIRRE